MIVIFLIYFFLLEPIREKLKKEKKEDVREGIIIHWKDSDGIRNFVKNDRNMIAGWGKVKVYPDGDTEYLPDSNRGRLYRGEWNWNFNPYLESSWRKLDKLKAEGYDIYWADGTDKFSSPKTFKILVEGEE